MDVDLTRSGSLPDLPCTPGVVRLVPPLPVRLETASRRVLGPPGSPPQLHSPTRRRPAGPRPGPRSALPRTPARRRFPPLARPLRPGPRRMGDRAGAGSNCGSVAEVRTEIQGLWLSRSILRAHGVRDNPRSQGEHHGVPLPGSWDEPGLLRAACEIDKQGNAGNISWA